MCAGGRGGESSSRWERDGRAAAGVDGGGPAPKHVPHRKIPKFRIQSAMMPATMPSAALMRAWVRAVPNKENRGMTSDYKRHLAPDKHGHEVERICGVCVCVCVGGLITTEMVQN